MTRPWRWGTDRGRVGGMDPARIRDAMKTLAGAPRDVFGAIGHRFLLRPPRPEADVAAFEARHGVALPGDYRDFITQVGDGGAGPYYGVFPLGWRDANVGDGLERWREGDGFVGSLSRPFPLIEPWNDLIGMPDEELSTANEAEYERKYEAFEERYWDSSRVDGAIPICHKGCALRLWLVVSGSEAGRLWDDRRAEQRGLSPLLLKSGARATFSSWYEEWLEDALQAPAVTR